jgi:hypothetical protein
MLGADLQLGSARTAQHCREPCADMHCNISAADKAAHVDTITTTIIAELQAVALVD